MPVPNPNPVRITVIGAGYLGLTHAACMADLGHDVLALDVDQAKIDRMARGEAPFFEPGLEPMLQKSIDSGRLRFTTSYAEAGRFGELHFVCVGTPSAADGAADLSYVHAAVDSLAPHLESRCLIVGKSTVPVGTARALSSRIGQLAPAGSEAELAWNPEFLREGYAIQDSLLPDRLVFGVGSAWAEDLLRSVYAQPLAQGVPCLVMDLETAELVKVAANAFLATKISFVNAMAEVCEAVGADVLPLAAALGHDGRIGSRFLAPGLGFGGGCLPKDIRAFRSTSLRLGLPSLATILGEVDAINMGRRARVVELARSALGGSVAARRVAALGIAFKPDSDDVRDSASLDVCGRLAREGAVVSVHDPVATANAAVVEPSLTYSANLMETVAGADLVLHLTEWQEYRAVDPAALALAVAEPKIIDARCILDPGPWRAAGWSFQAVGRP